MLVLVSKVISTPFRNQECPPRLLRRHSGDSEENILFQYSKGPDILWNASLIFIHVIFDIDSYLNSIQESRMFSKTPWRTFWRLITECALPKNLEAYIFAQTFLTVYLCQTWRPKSLWLHSEIRNVLKEFLVDAIVTHRKISSSSSPRSRKFCTELTKALYTWHSWILKSSPLDPV